MNKPTPFDALAQARRDSNPEVNRYHSLVGRPGEIDPYAAQDLAYVLEARPASAEDVQPDHYETTLADTSHDGLTVIGLAHKLGEADRAGDVLTTSDDVLDVLLDKVDAMAHSQNLSPEARTALFNRVLRAANLSDADAEVVTPEDKTPFDWAKHDSGLQPQAGEAKSKDADKDIIPIPEVKVAPRKPRVTPTPVAATPTVRVVRTDTTPTTPIRTRPADADSTPTSVLTIPRRETRERLSVKLTAESAKQERAERGEDRIIQDDGLGLYAVFDGAGGGGGSARHAAEAASRGIERAYIEASAHPLTSVDEAIGRMRHAFARARKEVMDNIYGGLTTAIVLKVEEVNGKTYGIWGNAGDSPLFLRRANGTIDPISTEQCLESEPHVITNCFGNGRPGYDGRKDEFGAIELFASDRLMLCSDGITGDQEWEKIDPKTFAEAFSDPTLAASAVHFLAASKKPDDKSVIVVGIK